MKKSDIIESEVAVFKPGLGRTIRGKDYDYISPHGDQYTRRAGRVVQETTRSSTC
jgi:hypothetical protein